MVHVRHLAFLLLTGFCSVLYGQSKVIEGIVLDKITKEPLIGAGVGIKDGLDGASTDASGKFRFETDEKGPQVLLFTYFGYKTTEYPIDLNQPQTILRIMMSENPTDIQEVVISAGAFEASDEKKGVVLKPLDIVTIPGANGDITGALNTLPGTTVNGESGQLIVRGGSASETRIYIDGLAVRNFYSTGLQDVPVRSRFSPFQFKGTTFASGGYSAEYGQALSSTLILNTEDMPAQGGKFVGLSCLGVNVGITRLKKRYAWNAAAGYTNLAPYMSLVKQNLNFVKAPESGFFASEGRIKTGANGIVKMGVQGSLSQVKIAYPKLPFEQESFSLGVDNRNARAFLTWRQSSGEQWTFYSALQAEINDDRFDPNTYGDFSILNSALSSRFTASYTPGNRLRWRNGAEYSLFHLRYSFLGETLQHGVGAVYSELETYLGNRFVLRSGLRAEQDFLLKKANIAPRISAAFKTGPDSQLSASWGLFYQSADDTLLFRYRQVDFEQAQHAILNYQITKNNRIFRVETYYKHYDRLLRTLNGADNEGDGYARGLELFFRDRETLEWGDFWISYSYLDTKRQFRDYPVSTMPTFAATHNASFVFKYYFNKPQLATNFSYTWQTGRPFFNPNNPVFLADRTPAYHNLSVQVSKLTSIGGNFTILVLSVNNVLGIRQVFNYRYTAVPGTMPQEYFRQDILPPAPSFFFLGCFINIGDKRTKVTKAEALE